MQEKKLTLAFIQLAATPDRSENMRNIRRWVERAPEAALLIFPEYACCLGSTAEVRAAVRPLEELDEEFGSMACRYGRALCFGGVPAQVGAHVYNSLLVYDSQGYRVGRYDKSHLFPSPQAPLDEADVFQRGDREAVTLDWHGWRLGFSICFDLRFPELFRSMERPDILLCPAAFTLPSGRAHWHVLLRARAIENQCYVVAPDQCAPDRYGHSLVVDPWGEVLLDAGEAEGAHAVTLHRQRIQAVRKVMPALSI